MKVPKRKVSEHYVDNKKFYKAIVDYLQERKNSIESGTELPRIPDYIGECIYKIAIRMSSSSRFINYSFRSEMIGDGIENCFLYFHSFNPDKTENPFAYFTQIVKNAFKRRILEEEKIRYSTYKSFQNTMVESEISDYLLDSDDNPIVTGKLYDNINDFIVKFEDREVRKKAKRKEKKDAKLLALAAAGGGNDPEHVGQEPTPPRPEQLPPDIG